MAEKVKAFFELEQDEDGYPGFASESVWAEKTQDPDMVKIDNIPFFATVATLGDVVRVYEKQGVLWFKELIVQSSNSLMRVVFFDEAQKERVSDDLAEKGCETEYMSQSKLLAVSIPKPDIVEDIRGYLQQQADAGFIDYEEPILRD